MSNPPMAYMMCWRLTDALTACGCVAGLLLDRKTLIHCAGGSLYIVQQTPHSLRQFADIIVVADRRAFADAAALILF